MDATRPFRILHAFIVSMALLVCSVMGADFDSANRAYDAGDFETARKEYQALVDAGQGTANVFYNLGNAEFRAGNLGAAILGYERALALKPDHPEAARNLALAREQAGAKVRAEQWYDRLFPAWHVNAFISIATVAGWAAVFAFIFMRLFRTVRGLLGTFGTAALLLALYAGGAVWRTEQERSLAIITTKEAVARLAPAEQSGVAGTFPAGSRVNVLSERGDWVYCRLPGEQLGWIPAADLQRVRLKT